MGVHPAITGHTGCEKGCVFPEQLNYASCPLLKKLHIVPGWDVPSSVAKSVLGRQRSILHVICFDLPAPGCNTTAPWQPCLSCSQSFAQAWFWRRPFVKLASRNTRGDPKYYARLAGHIFYVSRSCQKHVFKTELVSSRGIPTTKSNSN